MKKGLLTGALSLLLLAATTGCSQNNPKESKEAGAAKAAQPAPGSDAPITAELTRLSDFMKFDYKGILERCKKGDQEALVAFLDFHRIVEEQSALDHAVICLEMIPIAQDGQVAEACGSLKDKLKEMIRERLVKAQALTQKPELKKNISEWAPRTWAALSNQSYDPNAGKTGEQPAVLPSDAKPKEKIKLKMDTGSEPTPDAPADVKAPVKKKGN